MHHEDKFLAWLSEPPRLLPKPPRPRATIVKL